MTDRRTALELSVLGDSSMLLPHAAAAASTTTPSGDSYTEGALFYFTQVSGSQFGFTWVRADGEDPFDFTVTVEVVEVPTGRTEPSVSSYEYGPYESGAAGTGAFGSRQVAFNAPLYGGTSPSYGDISGTRFRAVFTSATGPAQARTISLASQSGDDAW